MDAQAPVVTLWETYGSGAETVGRALAQRLGVPFVGQRYSSEDLEAELGRGPVEASLLSRLLATLGRAVGTGDSGRAQGAAVAEDVSEGVADLRAAVSGGGVVLGRNGTVILADLPHALHVKLDGPLEARIARAASAQGIDEVTARARQAREDAVRAEMSQRLHNWDPRSNDRFDLVLNTARLPEETVVAMIVADLEIKARGATLS